MLKRHPPLGRRQDPGSSAVATPTDSDSPASSTDGSASSSSAQQSSVSSPPPTSPPPTSSSSTPIPPPASPPPDSSSSTPSPTPPPNSSSDNPTSSSNSGSSGIPLPVSSSNGSSTGASSASSSLISSTSTQTMTSTFVTTDAAGSTVTSTVLATHTIVSTLPGTSSSSSGSGSSSHTGAIVGGVVGGIAGLAALALVLYFFCRRRKRNDFDGNFDPDRVVGLSGAGGATLPRIDLAGADEVEPYQYTPTGYTSGPSYGSGRSNGGAPGEMREHNVPPFLAGGMLGAGAGAAAAGRPASHRVSPPATSAPSAPSAYSHSSSGHYQDYAAYSAYAAGAPPAQDFRHPSPGPSITGSSVQSPTGSGSAAGGVIPSSKEREAMGRRGEYVVANQDGQGEAPPVVQHSDGGRLDSTPEEEEVLHEVPPRYDSIPRDH